MSAMNFIAQREALHFFCDGARYDLDGVVGGFSSKLHTLPHLPAVVAARGSSLAGPILANEFGQNAGSFDELIERAEMLFCEAHARYLKLFSVVDPLVELYIGGWSQQRRKMEVYFISSVDKKSLAAGETLPEGMSAIAPDPFTLIEIDPSRGGLAPSIDQHGFEKAFGAVPGSIDDIGPIDQFAIGVMELQRERTFSAMPGRPAMHFVGGFVELVTITRDEIHSRVIHRWPDCVGEPISPQPIDWPRWRAERCGTVKDMVPEGLSRLQRQRLEKKARKGTLRAV